MLFRSNTEHPDLREHRDIAAQIAYMHRKNAPDHLVAASLKAWNVDPDFAGRIHTPAKQPANTQPGPGQPGTARGVPAPFVCVQINASGRP